MGNPYLDAIDSDFGNTSQQAIFPDARREESLAESQPTLQDLAQSFVDAGIPTQINSAYRDPKHNAEVGGVPNSYHTLGLGLDIAPQPKYKAQLEQLAASKGFQLIDESKTKNHYHFEPIKGSPLPTQQPQANPYLDAIDSSINAPQVAQPTTPSQNEVPTIGPETIHGKEYIPPPIGPSDVIRSIASGIRGPYDALVSSAQGQPGILGMEVPQQTPEGQRSQGAMETAAQRIPSGRTAGAMLSSLVPLNPIPQVTNQVVGLPLQSLLKAGGKAVGNMYAREPLASDVGQTISEQTPSLSKQGVLAKAQEGIKAGTEMKKAVLDANNKLTVSALKLARDPEIIDAATSYTTAGKPEITERLLKQLIDIGRNGEMDGKTADRLRQTFWELSKYTAGGDAGAGIDAKFNNLIGGKLRGILSDTFGPQYDAALKLTQKNIGVADAMQKLIDTPAPRGWPLVGRGVAATFSHGITEIPGYAATATPLASLLNRGGNIAGKLSGTATLPLTQILASKSKKKNVRR